MKFEWMHISRELRHMVLPHVKFYEKEKDKVPSAVLAADFKFKLFETDRFHPFNTDGDLARALEHLPEYCNYRRIGSYGEWVDRKEQLCDALYDVLLEMEDLIRDYYGSSMNFAPGYKVPFEIVISDFTTLASKSTYRLMRAGRKTLNPKDKGV